MTQPKTPEPVKLFIAVITSDDAYCKQAELALIEKFGPIDLSSEYIPFTFTNYYQKEMGDNLLRKFYSFEKLIHPGSLPNIKLWTNDLELAIAHPDRKINLDPGYLTGAKMILATTKNYAHRIYLDKDIYAEVTLRYRKKSYEPFDYTYPDYATPEYIRIFNRIRDIYLKQILG